MADESHEAVEREDDARRARTEAEAERADAERESEIADDQEGVIPEDSDAERRRGVPPS
jgi:hypothetical protein